MRWARRSRSNTERLARSTQGDSIVRRRLFTDGGSGDLRPVEKSRSDPGSREYAGRGVGVMPPLGTTTYRLPVLAG